MRPTFLLPLALCFGLALPAQVEAGVSIAQVAAATTIAVNLKPIAHRARHPKVLWYEITTELRRLRH